MPASKRIRRGWLLEITVGVGIYFLYDWLRDRAMGTTSAAFAHAKEVVRAQRALGLYQERAVQRALVDAHWLMSLANIYYGTVHFVLPVVALVWLYRKAPARYLLWRNALLFMLGIALLGFWLYPLMPPRLMPSRYGFVDTAARYYNFGPQQRVRVSPNGTPSAASVKAFGNLYAAMPSLHAGWSLWSALAVMPIIRRRRLRWLALLYPACTLFAIVVTANHWILDAVGGWLTLAAGYGLAVACSRLRAPAG